MPPPRHHCVFIGLIAWVATGASVAQIKSAPPSPLNWGGPPAGMQSPIQNAAGLPGAVASPLPAEALKTQPRASPQQAFEDAQKLHREHRLAFGIALTPALGMPTVNLRAVEAAWQRAAQVNARAAQALRDEAADRARMPGGGAPQGGLAQGVPQLPRSTSAGRFDWRDFNIVSPVRDQALCGSCWAFASAAAFESSHRLRNNKAIDVSEQALLDCNTGSCNGGNTGDVFDQALPGADGLVLEADYAPYGAAKASRCMRRPDAARLHAVAWGFVNAAHAVPSNAQLKQALIERGPLAVGLFAGRLFQAYRPVPNAKNGAEVFTYGVDMGDSFAQPYPDEKGNVSTAWFKVAKDGSLRGTHRGELLSDVDAMAKAWLAVDHMVLLVGWDDQRQAWLIKNSWGRDWGLYGEKEAGYGWVRYGQGNLGAYAAWVQAAYTPLGRATSEPLQRQTTVTPQPNRTAPVLVPPAPAGPALPSVPAVPTTLPRRW